MTRQWEAAEMREYFTSSPDGTQCLDGSNTVLTKHGDEWVNRAGRKVPALEFGRAMCPDLADLIGEKA